jgi:hypothetical protein
VAVIEKPFDGGLEFALVVLFAFHLALDDAQGAFCAFLIEILVRSHGTDAVLARAINMLIARAAYREAARMYPEDLIELRQGARVIEKSK